jgi:hypothetical protein
MRDGIAVTKTLLKTFALGAALYVGFRFVGDFSFRQSLLLTFVALAGYGLYEKLSASQGGGSAFSPFSVSIGPKWYDLLLDFKLIRTDEDWQRLCNAPGEAAENGYTVLRNGFTFTVIKPPADDGLPPGLAYWDNRKTFLAKVELSEAIAKVDDLIPRPGRGEKHPFFHHPKWASLPRLFFRWGRGGYEIGLEVQSDWWEELCNGGETGGFAGIKTHTDRSCGTTRLAIATLPYSEFGFYYGRGPYGHLKKQQELMDKQLEANGWARKIERNFEFRDPWSSVEHKYFTASHRGI